MLSLDATNSKKRARNDDAVMVDIIQETDQSCLIDRETFYLIEQFTRQQFVPTGQILPEKVYIYDEIIAVLLHKVNGLVEERASKRSKNDEDDHFLFSRLLNDLIRQNANFDIVSAMLGSSCSVIDRNLIRASASAGNDMFAFVMGHECVRRSLSTQLYLEDLSVEQLRWLCNESNKMLYGKELLSLPFFRFRSAFIAEPSTVFKTLGEERCREIICRGFMLEYFTEEQFAQSDVFCNIINNADLGVLKFVFSWLTHKAIFKDYGFNEHPCYYAQQRMLVPDSSGNRELIFNFLVNEYQVYIQSTKAPVLLLEHKS